MIKFGLKDIKDLYIGEDLVQKGFVGDDLIYVRNTLPYDAEIEYLESTGTQYIETNILPSASLRIVDCYKCTAPNNVAGGSGVRATNNSNWSWGDREDGNFTIILASTWQNLMSRDSAVHVFDYTSGAQYIDGVRKGSVNYTGIDSDFTKGVVIFARYSQSAQSYTYQQCQRHYIKMWKDDELVFDGIPVRKDGIGYLYDRVTETLFGNDGMGDFILGNDKNS